MPTKRRRIPRVASEALDWRYYALRDMPRPPDVKPPRPWAYTFDLQDDWNRERDTVLREWIMLHPGTRPAHWWTYDAPDEDRRRVGGVGDAYWTAMPGTPESYFRGMPNRWWTASDAEFLTHTYIRQQPSPAAVFYDESNPPRYEAESVYLERLGLLMPGEKVTPRDPEVCPVEPFLDFARRLHDLERSLGSRLIAP